MCTLSLVAASGGSSLDTGHGLLMAVGSLVAEHGPRALALQQLHLTDSRAQA